MRCRSRALRCRSTWHIAWLDARSDHGHRRLPRVPTCRPGDGDPLAETMRLLWREHLRKEPAPLALAHLLPLMGLHLQRLLGEQGLPSRLERLWQTVDADLAATWTLKSLARELGVGQERLRRLCQKRYGESPAARLRRLRLDRAAALVTATDLSIAEIAQAVGYSDPESFATAFRRAHGRSPRSLRRS